jgi:hypothetical protein
MPFRPAPPYPIVTPAESYFVRGTVSDDATGEPIFGANVRLIEFRFGATVRAEATTQADGRFFFATPYCDTCFLTAGHPDYYGPAQAFSGTRDRVTVVDFRLSRR